MPRKEEEEKKRKEKKSHLVSVCPEKRKEEKLVGECVDIKGNKRCPQKKKKEKRRKIRRRKVTW